MTAYMIAQLAVHDRLVDDALLSGGRTATEHRTFILLGRDCRMEGVDVGGTCGWRPLLGDRRG